MSPAFAASTAVAARAFGPSSAMSADKVSGPRELLITTLYPFATASRAIWLPICPAPMIPIVVVVFAILSLRCSVAQADHIGPRTNDSDTAEILQNVGVPGGIRTRVTAVKGRCPRPG